eukprot:6184147-Pleurochrysis_carterae.AAC.1
MVKHLDTHTSTWHAEQGFSLVKLGCVTPERAASNTTQDAASALACASACASLPYFAIKPAIAAGGSAFVQSPCTCGTAYNSSGKWLQMVSDAECGGRLAYTIWRNILSAASIRQMSEYGTDTRSRCAALDTMSAGQSFLEDVPAWAQKNGTFLEIILNVRSSSFILCIGRLAALNVPLASSKHPALAKPSTPSRQRTRSGRPSSPY